MSFRNEQQSELRERAEAGAVLQLDKVQEAKCGIAVKGERTRHEPRLPLHKEHSSKDECFLFWGGLKHDLFTILAFTHTGYTPKLLAKLRPSTPIIAISDLETTCRRLNLYWGITPFFKEWDQVLDSNMLSKIDEFIYQNTELKKMKE